MSTSTLLLAMILALAVGCAEAPPAEEGLDALGNPEVGVVNDAAGFYVRAMKAADYTYYTHKGTDRTYAGSTGTWSQECVAGVGDDIVCYVEAPEYDLYFNGVTLQHNIPSTMCTYAQISMPWHYKFPAGFGPSSVTYTQDATSGATTDGTNSALGFPYCPFDYTRSLGPNCCQGSYTIQVTVTGSTDPPPAPVRADWGGNASACLAGPALDLHQKDSSGYPLPDVYFIKGVGINGTYVVESPMSKKTSQLYVANYFDLAAGKDYGSLDYHDVPPAINPYANAWLENLSAGGVGTGTTIPGSSPSIRSTGAVPYGSASVPFATQPFYEYVCYNNYKEVKARIRVMVRSWDVEGTMASGSAYDPNHNLEGGVGGSESNHDFMVFGDLFFNYFPRRSIPNSSGLCGGAPGTPFPACITSYLNPLTTFSTRSGFGTFSE